MTDSVGLVLLIIFDPPPLEQRRSQIAQETRSTAPRALKFPDSVAT